MIHRTEPNDEYQDSPLEQLGYEMQYVNEHLMNRADNLGKPRKKLAVDHNKPSTTTHTPTTYGDSFKLSLLLHFLALPTCFA